MIAAVMFTTFLAVNLPAVRVAATAPPVECSGSTACAVFENLSTGLAIEAESTGGTGAIGVTASGSYLEPGIEGESDAVTGSDAAAAFGLNFLVHGTAPAYGVLAYGALNGLYGATENSGRSYDSAAGVFGQDDGVSAEPDNNAGVLGASSVGTGVFGLANGSQGGVYFGSQPVGLYAVAESNQLAYGLVAESNETALTAINPAGNSGGTAIVQLAGVGGLVASEFVVPNHGQYYFDVDAHGNGAFSGTLSADQAPGTFTRGASGVRRMAYGSRTASPEIEDVGEGELTNGRGDVALDPALADSIDMRRPYQVFVTPEGECNGLYVARKSPAGFVVREQQGGRSTLAFEYRIVGKPFDDDGARFAVPPPPPKLAALPPIRRSLARIGVPLSPEARLRQRIGTQAYAQALLEKRSNGISFSH